MKYILNFLLLVCAVSTYSQASIDNKYYRHLKYNHVSPYIDLIGIHPIDEITAQSTSHYVFKYGANQRLVNVINNHYHTETTHPLASIGVYNMTLEYDQNQEVRLFYDIKGNRIANDRSVYKEVYTYDPKLFKSKLQFYDLEDKPMESNWGIAEYHWSKHQDLIIEHRFDLQNEAVNLSPYFEFGVTGILLHSDGSPNVHYNLDQDLNVINNSLGVASYRDLFDQKGDHITYNYFNAKDSLTPNQWGFAIGKKSYDSLGNNILLEHYDTNNKFIRSRTIPSNASIELSAAASYADSSEIKRISLGYLKALQKMDPILMAEVMNDSLNKVTIGRNCSSNYLRSNDRVCK